MTETQAENAGPPEGWADNGGQFEPCEVTPGVLAAWEEAARMGSHHIRPGDWNWPRMVRSLATAIRTRSAP